ncbi:hypothetical protein MOC47_08840 [Bacillus spizizenii]|nr:hypothetical protein [Bacillus spizizenii]MCY7830335.1 hypothetical protein [Bacillus spizizenii]MCY7839664.1 hypothetical protein [Bacillus spizizenii]MCY8229632.1 hypothetical protein [Bacillus spizizenii]MCY8328954.1 hypothetical protein [Bacillus spizizenii]
MIMRGESNTYIKVKSVLDNSTPEDAKRNKNLIYLFTLLKGISLIIPLAYNGLIMHENILILCWTAFSVIYTVLSMFKVLDVLEGETVGHSRHIYLAYVFGNLIFALSIIFHIM